MQAFLSSPNRVGSTREGNVRHVTTNGACREQPRSGHAGNSLNRTIRAHKKGSSCFQPTFEGKSPRGFDNTICSCLASWMSEDTELLKEIRDLLRLMAEPAIAERDKKLRASLIQVVGKSQRKADAVILMDGTRSQSAIRKECGIDMGDLSRLVKALREASLIQGDDKPKAVVPVPTNFLETWR